MGVISLYPVDEETLGFHSLFLSLSLSLSPLMRETGYQLTIRKTRLNVGVLAAKDQHPMLAE